MTVRNRQAEAIRSKCSPEELAQALQSLDLSKIDPDKRHMAIRHRIAEVMLATTTDPAERAKDSFQDAVKTWASVTHSRRQNRIILP